MGPVGYLGWLFPLAFTLFVVWTWRLDYRLYKGDFRRALKVTYSAAISSRAKFFLWAAVFLMAGALLGVILLGRELLFPVCSYISVAAATVTWVVRPPGVVLLASSGSRQARRLAATISRTAMGHRVLYFLDPLSRHAIGAIRSSPFDGGVNELMNNRFLRADDRWGETVFTLLELVPVIVVDASRLSDGLEFEMRRINSSPSLSSKTLVMAGGASEFILARYPRLAGRVVRPTEVQEAVIFALSGRDRRSLAPPVKSKPRPLPAPQCRRCGSRMRVVTGNVIYRKDVRTQGCFQCRVCARYTCYDCSDSREPCECGQKQWVERSYFLD